MAIARFENISVNNLTFGQSAFGEQSTTQALWFQTRARVHSVANNVKITDKGMNLLAQIDSEADLMHAICKSLTQQEKETLNTLLDKFRN